MTILQLRYFVSVATHGKISEAAKELFISQPTLTNAIQDLEEELGFLVFNRTNRGIAITKEGTRFLGYARQVLEQMSILESTFLEKKQERFVFQVSTQHYSFVVNAFVDLISELSSDDYELTLRECRTYEIIDDVKNNRSQLGVIYLNQFNELVMKKYLKENHLVFKQLFVAQPHVFISQKHPLASKEMVSLEDLEQYPFLSFEQGEHNSFYFSEEILSTVPRNKVIKVSDRATLFNLLIGVNGYTICTGIISKDLNGEDIISKRLLVDDEIRLGIIYRKDETLTSLGQHFEDLIIKHTAHIQNNI